MAYWPEQTTVFFPADPYNRSHGSSTMQRTLSGATDNSTSSVGTSYSAFGSVDTSSSGISSPSVGESLYQPDNSTPYSMLSYGDTKTTDHYAEVESQYQNADTQQGHESSALVSLRQVFDDTIYDIQGAAWQATQDAQSELLNQNSQLRFFHITSEAVESNFKRLQKRSKDASYREAVQDVLYRHLLRQFSDRNQVQTDVNTALREAAYQLLLQVEGDEASGICYYAIAATLDRLQRGLPNTQTATRYRCERPECKGRAFNRSADLERHYEHIHVDDDKKKKKFLCDYRKCNRHEAPFFRRDHFRDHLRDFHKEDLLRRGTKSDEAWWKGRSDRAMSGGWWRCNRCLDIRVDYGTYGFVCPQCGMHCEAERQRHR
ncbi:hypothetical protein B0H66DRAFT_301077 [Apodospora peruviana]|uniref:C2H2-type domain-containing protein n=1 Tax=Apodospora peruviana TaxID=516989 RepID=A0AAE0M3L1_9PEZI|nr:hypothetical protein B0H66DRAFT_301077 [Apodospora peruviana]